MVSNGEDRKVVNRSVYHSKNSVLKKIIIKRDLHNNLQNYLLIYRFIYIRSLLSAKRSNPAPYTKHHRLSFGLSVPDILNEICLILLVLMVATHKLKNYRLM